MTARRNPSTKYSLRCGHCGDPINNSPHYVPGAITPLHLRCKKAFALNMTSDEGLPRPVIWHKGPTAGSNVSTKIPAFLVARYPSGIVVVEFELDGVKVRRNTTYDNVSDLEGKYIDP